MLVITDPRPSQGWSRVLQNVLMDLVDISPHAVQTAAENKPREQPLWSDCLFSEDSSQISTASVTTDPNGAQL